jgi:hypothetical protein
MVEQEELDREEPLLPGRRHPGNNQAWNRYPFQLETLPKGDG